MPAWIANTAETILDFSNILNASIAASWLILAVLLLRILLKKAPKWSHVALWGLVALRLLIPFSIESRFSLIPSAETVPQAILRLEGTQLHGQAQLDIVSNPVYSGAFTPQISQTVDQMQTHMVVFTWVWLFGIAAMLLYTTVSYLRLRRSIGTAVLFRDNIYQSEHIGSPFVLGIIRPKIYLPFQMDGKNFEHVVAHEQAHIRRRDHWWKPLGFILLAFHWFNPLMWLAYVLLCRDIELACDEKVIRELGDGQRADYSQAMLSCSVNRKLIAACPLAFGEVGVKERVRSVLSYQKPAFWIVILAVIACIVVAVCFLTNPANAIRNPAVQEYVPGAPGILGTVDKDKFERISDDFAIGADEYGRAVFKDPYKAFDTMVELYTEGIALIQKSNDLSPISRSNYSAYKTFGWQMTSGPESAQEQAAFITRFLDIYENSFEKEPPAANTEIPTTEPTPAVQEWFDYSQDPGAYANAKEEITHKAFPGVTFRYAGCQIIAENENGHTVLIEGMPIWNACFCDLTGDGLPEICVTLSFGSGMIDEHILVYDYANGAGYELEDRGNHDYTLSVQDGRLVVTKRVYNSSTVVETGYLAYVDGTVTIIPTEVPSSASSDLDQAILKAILDRYASEKPDGLIHTASYVLLSKEVISGTPLVGQNDHMEKEAVYLLVQHIKYSTYGGKLEARGGSYIPTAITFSIDENGNYILEEYWEPRDGGYYTDDIREKFPAPAAEEVFSKAQDYVDDLNAQCYRQALDCVTAAGGLDAEIERLLGVIMSSPAESSNPGAYISAHDAEYQRLLDYGEFTLRYCFAQFLQGGQNDLRGHIMAIACREIAVNWGEAILMWDSDPPIQVQARFDAFLSNAQSLAQQYSNEELEKHYPVSWLLLQMIGEKNN